MSESRVIETSCCGLVDLDAVPDMEWIAAGRFSIGVESAEFVGTTCPWHKTIECKHGNVCPSGRDYLWAASTTRTGKYQLLLLVESDPTEYLLRQHGDDGVGIEFRISHVQRVLRVLKAIKLKRRVSV